MRGSDVLIEPVFAHLFNRLGPHLNYRGEHISTELHLWAATHNLLKAIRVRARTNPASPDPAASPGQLTRPARHHPVQARSADPGLNR